MGLNAVSSLIAFCNYDEARKSDTTQFQHFLVRLMSMLHCAALQQIASVDDDRFEIINPQGMDKDSLLWLSTKSPEVRCEVVLQWLQRLIVEAQSADTLMVPPPILTRAYQELSRGIITLHQSRIIK